MCFIFFYSGYNLFITFQDYQFGFEQFVRVLSLFFYFGTFEVAKLVFDQNFRQMAPDNNFGSSISSRTLILG